MIYTIEEIKEKTIPIAKKYGIDSMSLFGSYARGEATENSDVDFYIDKGDIKGLLDYIGFVPDPSRLRRRRRSRPLPPVAGRDPQYRI